MFYLLLAGTAESCDLAVFRNLPTPVPAMGAHGVATSEATFDGMPVVGGNFSRLSVQPISAWKVVLSDAGSQDVWVPRQFGYEKSDYIDPTHLYLAMNLSFLGDMFHVRRQLVAEVHNVDTPTGFQSCWWMVDPAPYLARIAAWTSDAEWESAMYGRWEVTPRPDGTTLVSYQWWAQAGKVPSPILRYAVSRTMPELLDAFDRRVTEIAGRK